jgi:hypothetical protein
MTPQEKAEELVDKFMDYSDSRFNVNNDLSPLYTAKQCALIAVDEVIESLHEHHWQNRLIINYWEEVKKEIENYG